MPISDEERERINKLGEVFAQRPQMVVHEMVRRTNGQRVLIIGFMVQMQGRMDFFPFGELIAGLPQDHYIPLDPNLRPRQQPFMPISDFAAGVHMGMNPPAAQQGEANVTDRRVPQERPPEGPAAGGLRETLLPGLGGPRRR